MICMYTQLFNKLSFSLPPSCWRIVHRICRSFVNQPQPGLDTLFIRHLLWISLFYLFDELYLVFRSYSIILIASPSYTCRSLDSGFCWLPPKLKPWYASDGTTWLAPINVARCRKRWLTNWNQQTDTLLFLTRINKSVVLLDFLSTLP